MKTAPFLFTFQTDLHLLRIFDSCQNEFPASSKVEFISLQISLCSAALLPQEANTCISSSCFCFLPLYKRNLFHFFPSLNMWVTAVFRTLALYSVHHCTTNKFPFSMYWRLFGPSWSCHHTFLHHEVLSLGSSLSFPTTPVFTDVSSHLSFSFFLSAFIFGPPISSISPTRTATVIRCQ